MFTLRNTAPPGGVQGMMKEAPPMMRECMSCKNPAMDAAEQMEDMERELRELRKIRDAAEMLFKVKGRFHTQRATIVLAEALGLKAQDPMNHMQWRKDMMDRVLCVIINSRIHDGIPLSAEGNRIVAERLLKTFESS